jgi:hypothetical protein
MWDKLQYTYYSPYKQALDLFFIALLSIAYSYYGHFARYNVC